MVITKKQVVDFLGDLLFPKSCYGCGARDTYLCDMCVEDVAVKETQCPHCNVRVPFGKLPRPCRKNLEISTFFIPLDYNHKVVRKMVWDFKYRNCFILAEDLAKSALYHLNRNNALKNIDRSKTVIAPVPSHSSKVRKRGFNPAEKIAREVSRVERIPLHPKMLVKTRNIKPQASIKNFRERSVNVQEVFVVQETVVPKDFTILLVDDVYTTGSTVRECAKALKRCGYKKIGCLVVARD